MNQHITMEELHKDDTAQRPYAWTAKSPSLIVVLRDVAYCRIDAENRGDNDEAARYSAMEQAIKDGIKVHEKTYADALKGKPFMITPKPLPV